VISWEGGKEEEQMPVSARFIELLTLSCLALLTAFCLAPPAWGQTAVERSHLAQLAKSPETSSLTPVSIKNSVVRRKRGRDPIATLRIETSASADYLLKLVNAQNDSEEMVIYVSRNSKYETKVPLGTYTMRGASGTTWYGEQNLFGPDTSYFRLVRKDGTNRFTFQRSGNQINGYIIRLIPQVAGTLETPTIRPEDF
jgi:hypothetical protein